MGTELERAALEKKALEQFMTGKSLFGKDGAFAPMLKNFIEKALEAEMESHLSDEDKEFEETSAHEIGHEILQAFGGNVYSWQHKGSSYYMPQDKKPIGKESFKEEYINMDYMEETKGESYPKNGEEIDLMKYYHGRKPSNFYNRRVANKKDVVGLLWLTKLKLQ